MALQTSNKSSWDIDEGVYRQRWWTLGVLCLCLLMVILDNSIVNVALPTLAYELSARSSDLQWIVEAYSLILAGLLLTCGAVTDRIGNQHAMLLGLLIFGLASTLGAIAPNVMALILARGAMGVGGAFIMPATLSTVKKVFSEQERPLALGVWSAVSSLGIVIGPLLGGWLLEHFWWGSIFLINAPLVLIAILAALWLVPNLRAGQPSPIDIVGTIFSILGMVCLIFGITESSHLGWSSPLVVSGLIIGVLLLSCFVFWENVTSHPMLDLRLFQNPRFSIASFSVALAYFSLLGFTFLLTQYLQSVMGYSPLETGVRLLPMALGLLVASLVGGRLVQMIGRKPVIVCGLLLVVIGLLVFSSVHQGSGYEIVVVTLLLASAGLGIAGVASVDSIMSVVPYEQSGVASSVDETAIELGITLGVAVLGSVLASGYASSLQMAEGLTQAVRLVAQESIGMAVELANTIGGDPGAYLLSVARTAFIAAMSDASLLAAAITFFGACIALVFLPASSSKEEQEEDS